MSKNEVTIFGSNYDGALSDDREQSWNEFEDERMERELEEFSCTCGAYVINKKSGRIVHLADCLCGYG